MGTKFNTTKGTESVTYKILFAIKIYADGVKLFVQSWLLVFYKKAFHKRSNLLWRFRKNLEAKIHVTWVAL